MKKNYFVLNRKDHTKEWPFKENRVIIQKDGLALYVRIGHKKYNLNGVAKNGRPLEEIWLLRRGCEYRVQIGWVINLAHEMLK